MELTKKAQAVLNEVEAGKTIDDLVDEKHKLTEFIEQISTSDCFCYGIFNGGTPDPKDILKGEDLQRVTAAINLLQEFYELWQDISLEL